MNWNNKPIQKLSNDELKDAILKVADMDKFRLDRLEHPKAKKKFLNQPPPIENPAFTKLVTELNNEFQSRKLKGLANEKFYWV